MVDVFPQFESEDNIGSTRGYSGVATVVAANVPAVAGKAISGFMWAIDGENLEISADGGLTFFKVPKKSEGFKDIKGRPTQLIVKTSVATCGYSLWIDFED